MEDVKSLKKLGSSMNINVKSGDRSSRKALDAAKKAAVLESEENQFVDDQNAAPAPDKKLSAYKDSHREDSDEYEDDIDRAYADPKRKRDPGTGPIRLGTLLELNEGQYSLMFVASMRSDYIYYYTEVHGKEEDA